MFNWVFQKVVKMREKVAVDLGRTDEEKPFLDHLDDLRSMIVRMVVTLLVVTIGAFFFYQELMAILEHPLVVAGVRDKVSLQNLKVIGGFMTAMNISIVAGVISAFPVLLYFLLQFVLPGMRSNEKKVLFPAIAVGGGLFLVGVLFAYFFVVPRALGFFYEFSVEMDRSSVANTPGATAPDKLIWERVEYVKFVCQFILIFGACFELPVVVMALVKLDILNYKVMKTSRGWAAIIICVVSAIITPTQDAMTLALLAIPMYILYEICIWLAWGLEKRDRKLYPEYYKDLDEDNKSIEVADDWDNENYNPWSGTDQSDDDDEDEDGKSKPKPKPIASAPEASAPPSTDSSSSLSADVSSSTDLPAPVSDPAPNPAPPPAPELPPTPETGQAPTSSEPPPADDKSVEDLNNDPYYRQDDVEKRNQD